jgi:hypothetical protein
MRENASNATCRPLTIRMPPSNEGRNEGHNLFSGSRGKVIEKEEEEEEEKEKLYNFPASLLTLSLPPS